MREQLMPQDKPKEDLRQYLPSRGLADRLARGEMWKTPPTGVAGSASHKPAEAEHPAVTVQAPGRRSTRGAVWISLVAAACVLLTAAVAFWAGQQGKGKGEPGTAAPSVASAANAANAANAASATSSTGTARVTASAATSSAPSSTAAHARSPNSAT